MSTHSIRSLSIALLAVLKTYPPVPDRALRAPRPPIRPVQLHRWRHEWRKNMGADPKLWGDEQPGEND